MGTILVLDDDPLILGLVADGIEESGHRVIGCQDVVAARPHLERGPDLLLIDAGLARTAQDEAVRLVRRSSDPPILVLSSQKPAWSERLSRRLGAAALFYKPIDPVLLRHEVRRLMEMDFRDLGIPVSPRLLVVDDDPMVRLSVVDVLEDVGYDVHGAASGDEAIEILSRRPIEIVLTDVMMEGTSGLELVERLPRLRPLSLAIVMTGFASKDVALSALRGGAFDLLEKPLTPDLVTRAVERAWMAQRYRLENRRLLQELRKVNEELVEARDAAEAASRAKSQFLANMSHEVRTPLNGVMGCMSLLGKTLLDDRQQRLVQGAKISSERLFDMLSDTLEFAATESAMPVLQPAPLSPAHLLRRTVEEVRQSVAAKGLALHLEVSKSAPEWVHMDGERLARVLKHLIDNSCKFAPSGSIRVRLEQHQEALRLTVRDTGPGIPSHLHEAVFEPFYQVDSSSTRAAEGAGLGLSVCRRMVEAMGGTIHLETPADGGSAFVLRWPMTALQVPIEDEGSASKESRVQGEERRGRERRALLADDDPTNAFLLKRMLELLGFRVTCVEDGQLAVDAYAAQPPDVVLLDYQMPRMDGAEAAEAIRRIESERQLPRSVITVVTGFALQEFEQRCREAGVDQFLTKPLRFPVLEEASRHWFPA